jgi:hypothetical protein
MLQHGAHVATCCNMVCCAACLRPVSAHTPIRCCVGFVLHGAWCVSRGGSPNTGGRTGRCLVLSQLDEVQVGDPSADERLLRCLPNTQHEARNVQHAARNVQHAARNVQHAARNVQHAARNVQHATCNMQHAMCNMQHGTSESGSAFSFACKYVCSASRSPALMNISVTYGTRARSLDWHTRARMCSARLCGAWRMGASCVSCAPCLCAARCTLQARRRALRGICRLLSVAFSQLQRDTATCAPRRAGSKA